MKGTTVDLLIVEKPQGWIPKDWKDAPPQLNVLKASDRGIKHKRALGLLFGYNTASIDRDGSVWMIARVSGQYSCPHD